MRLLIDTHVAIWLVTEPERISAAVMALLADTANDVFVSAATVWEIAIKRPLNRPDAPPFSGQQAIEEFRLAGLAMLEVRAEHAAAVEALPLHHFDPFDRLIVAQAKYEPMRLVTSDAMLLKYEPSAIVF
jgi:PIN domain nuclease of toxin-antitoxin system